MKVPGLLKKMECGNSRNQLKQKSRKNYVKLP